MVERVSDVVRQGRTDLMLILQQWPDEFRRSDVQTLIDAAPLSRLVVCYGPWCDSDARTRDVWPLCSRVPVAAAPARLRWELRELAQSRPPIPLTANRNEAFLHRQPFPTLPRKIPLSIRVQSVDRDLTPLLCDVIAAAGHRVVDSATMPVDLIVWDADPWYRSSADELANLRAMSPAVPVIALSGFPRPHEVDELKSAGAASVVPKTLEIGLLLEQFERAAMKG